MRVAPYQTVGETSGIRIEQQLVAVEAVAALRLVRAVDPVTVALSGNDIVEIAVPDILGAFGQRDAFDLAAALSVEQAQLDLLRMGGEQREVGAPAIPGRAETIVAAGGDTHHDSSGTRKIAASGGIVRLSCGTGPSFVSRWPELPTLLPP